MDWSTKQTQVTESTARQDLIWRIEALERQMADTASFLQELADDVLERTDGGIPREIVA